ncbi:16S rRNA (guanine(966)-N(2))-methyltransferase RsmD [Massilia sp. Mn16-1_5]|uniref:16S rRNA (guanine(966)-N(2))-methyltransferase RsmD n=1 Tax=Massilia sp. Mn16-1_5 TaxID=2079199 RepID=UPI00109E4FEB|nr:16S rRNA (guanine(966)-N(2))-methyltransferase RsmD [Massilia sp. Mn16-1_5]THC41347.1 16S rRNA (guanine(966)-N(2))-methyltransferase RsmD [Massilia sp. Mn16-1_5]
MQKSKSQGAHGRPRLAPQQVRIIGGEWKRRLLPVLDALGLRPTPDRVRETVFNWLHHQVGGDWEQVDCLDLFAGSGALGFEAASRGARAVTMLDFNAAATRQLEANKDTLKATNVNVLRGDAFAVARDMAARGQRFDVIFLDPPYQQDFVAKALPLCTDLLKEDGLVYVEAEYALAQEEDTPDWLLPWEQIRADKAGMVYYHLLKLKDNLHENKA